MINEVGNFSTAEELKGLLERIGLKLHAKNRIAGGEDAFIWHLAEALRAIGHLSTIADDDPETEGRFGNGYEAGSIPTDERLDSFLAMLKKQMIAGH